MEIVVSILAIIGLACVVKHMMHSCGEGCCLCSWIKSKEEEVKSAVEKESHEKQAGTRYGSNPIRY